MPDTIFLHLNYPQNWGSWIHEGDTVKAGSANDWVFRHSKLIATFFSGCLLGLFVKAPGLPWVLSDGASTVFATAFATFVGLAGAAALTDSVLNRSEKAARDTLLGIVKPLVKDLDVAVGFATSWHCLGVPAKEKASTAFGALAIEPKAAAARLDGIAPSYASLGSDLTFALADIRRIVKALDGFAHSFGAWRVRNVRNLTGVDFKPHLPTLEALLVELTDVQERLQAR